MSKAKPFLKWAGGKSRLVTRLAEILPEEIDTYYEPFVGGGALFFQLARTRRFRVAVLNDFNPELVNCYAVIRDDVDALLTSLRALAVGRDAFYAIRALDPNAMLPVERAARTIYLNKTCFNGLYRQNKHGEFNTPFGDYASPQVIDEPNLRTCSALLQGVRLSIGDFGAAIADAAPGDAVYLDPPYVPLSATSSFKSYTSDGFTLEDQRRVVETCRQLDTRRVFFLASNSDTPLVHELYADFERTVVRMRRNINSDASGRGAVNELLILSHDNARTWNHHGL